jgi:Protein of unknown function (DUF3592)
MREFLCTGVGIVALVFSILGVVFTTVGLGLATFVRPQVIGITFLCIGSGILTVGVMLAAIRVAAIRRRARLLETGLESRGTIVDVAQNPLVRVNGRHPWVVRYRYEMQGCEYHGNERMMDLPAGYKEGASVTVMYDEARVHVSALKRIWVSA